MPGHKIGGKMMDLYFYEFLIKERQQQISDEFRRIHLARAKRRSGVGILKKWILRFGQALFALKIRLKKRYRLAVKPTWRSPDSCST